MKFLALASMILLATVNNSIAQDRSDIHPLTVSSSFVGLAAVFTDACDNGNDEQACAAAVTASSAAVFIGVMLGQGYKVELAAVKNDAINFLAGNSSTEALADQIQKIRESSHELATSSDEEIALAIALMN